jgi:hypothetical protein
MSFTVNLARVAQSLFSAHPIVVVKLAKKTMARAGVTGNTSDLVHD